MSGLIQLSGVIVDLIYRVDAVPRPGQEALVSGFTATTGGGLNAMVAARRSGMEVAYGGRIGTGPFGDLVARDIAAHGISIVGTRAPSHDQGCCTVLIDDAGERTFIAGDGAEGKDAPADLDALPLERFGWSLLSGYSLYHAGAREAFAGLLESGRSIPNLVFDPSPLAGEIPEKLMQAALNRAHWVSCNDTEARAITGEADPERAARILAKSASGGAVLRLGADGCLLAQGGSLHHHSAFRVDAIDTNGAGDAHVGSFIAALSRGLTPAQAAEYANVAAALSTTVHGPATAPSRAEVLDAMKLTEAG